MKPEDFFTIFVNFIENKNLSRPSAGTLFVCQTKGWFPFGKFSFCANTKCFGEELNAIEFLSGPKALDI